MKNYDDRIIDTINFIKATEDYKQGAIQIAELIRDVQMDTVEEFFKRIKEDYNDTPKKNT